METQWYYIHANQQLGPIGQEQFRAMLASGQVKGEQFCWRAGLVKWLPVSEVAELGVALAGVVTPGVVARPALLVLEQGSGEAPGNAVVATGYHPAAQSSSPMQYYSGVANLPIRAAAFFHDFPPLTGPSNDWPLDDPHLFELKQAAGYFKKTRNFISTCRALGAIMAIGCLIALIAMLSENRTPMEAYLGVMVGFGVSALMFVCASATAKLRTWGPLTMLVVMSLLIVAQFGFCLFAFPGRGRAQSDNILPVLLGCIFPAIVLASACSAMSGIRNLLRAPTWAVEAVMFSNKR